MKKVFISIAAMTLTTAAFAGGFFTNTNQNAHFLRNPSRGASTEIDAVYSNPAGLSLLEHDGLTLSLNNQTAFQTRTITSTFPPFEMNGGNATKEYEGKVVAPFIPSLQAAYKWEDFVFSGSFAIIGGGGTLKYDKGLPSFEAGIAGNLMKLSQASSIPSEYSLDMNLEGSSITYGVQLGASYKINEMFSAFVGGRVSIVNNGYEGYLRDVKITNADAMKTFFTTAATMAGGAAAKLQPAVAGGFGDKTLNELVGAGMATPQDLALMAAGLGTTAEEIGKLTASAAHTKFSTAAAQATGAAAGVEQLENANIELNTKQSGWGIAPILGFNFNYEKLNIGVKYEFKTDITLENKTTVNTSGIADYDDGAKSDYDIPALATLGISYKFLEDKLIASAGFHFFFDKDADMTNERQKALEGTFDGNSYEVLAGVEYKINDKFLVSAGGQLSRYGLADKFQSDMNFSCNSYSIGLGGAYNITDRLTLNLSYLLTQYDNYTNNTTAYGGTEAYARTNNAFGIGLDYKF